MLMITARNLTFAYPGKEPLFTDVDLELSDRLLWLSGENGCGKTTLCRLLTGLIPSESITMQDSPVYTIPAKIRFSSLLYLKQEPILNLVGLHPKEDLRIRANGFARTGIPDTRLNEVLTFWGLDTLAERPVYLLSEGEAKRTALCALSLFPNAFWILDEPFAGLDSAGGALLKEVLHSHRDTGHGALVIGHESPPDWVDEHLVIRSRHIAKE
jgi:energy-coupling factor transporter ATP-binding protein EcfA2